MEDLISTADLLRTGVSHADIRRKIASGEIVRVRRGYYRRRGRLGIEGVHLVDIRAALASTGHSVVISHASAAVLHHLPVPNFALANVSMSRIGSGRGRIGRGIHLRGTPLTDAEIVEIDGCHTTGLARTVVDLARVLPFDWAVAAADVALARLGGRAVLEEQLERSHGWPGNARARAVIAFADARSESVGESRSRATFAAGGVPAPIPQFEVRAHGRLLGRSDFAWPGPRLLGEFDGMSKYGEHARPGESPSDVLAREKVREERFRDEDWSVVRWTWSDLDNPKALCARVNQAIANADRRQRRSA